MKKLLSISLICIMAVSVFASCGKEGQSAESATSPVIQDTTTEAITEESTSISRDYRSGQIMIDGDLITLPIKVSDFMALGWQQDDDYDEKNIIEAKADIHNSGKWESGVWGYFEKGNIELDCFVYNWTDTDIAFSDGYIAQIDTDDESDCSVVIPGNFEVGKATKDEIVSKWGEPYNTRDQINSEEYQYSYEIDNYAEYGLKFFIGTDVLSGVTLSNIKKTSEMSSANKVYKVNLDVARNIKSRDNFEIKVSDMQIAEGALNTGSINFSGNDAFVISISNEGANDLSKVEILILAYKEDGKLVKVRSTYSIPDYRDDKFISMFESNDEFSLKAGNTDSIYIKCNASEYYGAQAIVYSYTDVNGSEHVNPLAQEWFETIYDR